MPSNQSSLFAFENEDSEQFEQASLLQTSPAMQQWRRTETHLALLDAPLARSENSVGLWGEGVIHRALRRIAEVGGYIEYQKAIGDARADFFISGLVRFPRGVVIESKVLTGEGSHDKKVLASMMLWPSLKYPAVVVCIGNVMSAQTRRLIANYEGADMYVYNLVNFVDWIMLTRKAQQMRQKQ